MKKLFNSLGFILIITIFSSCEEKPKPPILSTKSVTEVTINAAVSGGNVIDDGGASVISRGVCWNTTDNPVNTDNKTDDNGGLGLFTSIISPLSPNTKYYVRAYATNSSGTSYGASVSFRTLGDKPTSASLNVSDILTNSASLTGTINPNSLSTNVSFEYGPTTDYGSSSSAIQNPINGDINSYVSTVLSTLQPGKLYHFRLKAENSLGITFSNDMTFTTLGHSPTSLTQPASNVQVTTATLNGSVNPNYLPTTAFFEWGFTTNYGNLVNLIQNPFNGNSSININIDLSGLNPETTYHYRIKSTNELGTTYSDDFTFITYALKDLDNNLYHSVTIGDQTWMKTNLKTTHFKDSAGIPLVIADEEWNNLSTPAFCWYNNDETTYKDQDGALYNWYSVSTGKLCPTGWHIPSDLEWMKLINFLGGESIAGIKLKESGTSHWIGSNPYATNVSGFTALPSGARGNNGIFGNYTLGTWLWHSTEYSSWGGQVTYLQFMPNAYISPFDKEMGASVRCIKD